MIDLSNILLHVAPFLLVFFRLTGLFFFSPVLGSKIIPPFIKIHLALALAFVIYPVTPVVQQTDIALNIFTLAPLCAVEMLIGYIIGWVAGLPMISLQMSGLLMGQQMGLGLARFYNPGTETDSNVIGQVLFYMALGTFLMMGGMEVMVSSLITTFHTAPLATFRVNESVLQLIVGMLVASYTIAVRIAAPVYCMIFLQTVGVGFLSKTSPQINILSFGFPMRVVTGLIGFILSLGVMYMAIGDEVQRVIVLIGNWAMSLADGGMVSG